MALIDPVGKKYLFEATPNLPEQMVILEKEAPSTNSETAQLMDAALDAEISAALGDMSIDDLVGALASRGFRDRRSKPFN